MRATISYRGWIGAVALAAASGAWAQGKPQPHEAPDRRWSVAMEPVLQAVAVSRGGLHLDAVLELALGAGWTSIVFSPFYLRQSGLERWAGEFGLRVYLPGAHLEGPWVAAVFQIGNQMSCGSMECIGGGGYSAAGGWIGWQVVLPLLPSPAFIVTPAVGLGYDSWRQVQPWVSLAVGVTG